VTSHANVRRGATTDRKSPTFSVYHADLDMLWIGMRIASSSFAHRHRDGLSLTRVQVAVDIFVDAAYKSACIGFIVPGGML